MGKNMRIKTAPKANRVPLLGDGETSRTLSDLEEGSNVQVRCPAPFPQTPRSLPPPRANQLINLPLSLSLSLSLSVVFFIVKIGIISARERRVLSSNQVGE